LSSRLLAATRIELTSRRAEFRTRLGAKVDMTAIEERAGRAD
jgi:hypothetical protein